MKKTKTQKSEVLKFMQTHTGITSLQAINHFGATRLSDIIYTLEKEGHKFEKEQITKKNRYGHVVTYTKYKLV